MSAPLAMAKPNTVNVTIKVSGTPIPIEGISFYIGEFGSALNYFEYQTNSHGKAAVDISSLGLSAGDKIDVNNDWETPTWGGYCTLSKKLSGKVTIEVVIE